MLRALAIGLAVIGLASCAQESYESESTRDDLIEAGLTRDQANCVVREMNVRIKIERLGAREEPGDDERAEFAELYEDCTESG